MRVTINIPWHLFEQQAHAATSRAVRISAAEVGAQASENIRHVAPHIRRRKAGGKWVRESVTDLIDTGAMLSSGYLITGGGVNERPAAMGAAAAHQPGVSFGTPPTQPANDLEAQWNYAAEYAGPVEALYPFLGPAFEEVKPRIKEILRRELEKEGL